MMRNRLLIPALIACLTAVAAAQERGPLSIVAVQPLNATGVTATGRLQPVISTRLTPRVSGHLIEYGQDAQGRMLDAGAMVSKGQVIFRLNDAPHRNTEAAAAANLASTRAALDQLTAKTREERLDQLRQAVAELDARVADKQRDVERYKRLVEEDKTLPAKRLEEVQVDLSALQAQHKAAEARLREAENGPTKTEIAVAEARVKEAEVALKIAQDDLRDTVVRAPFDGLITRRFKSPGDYITTTPPTEVLELVSLDELEVEFRLPETYYTRLEAGRTPVRLTSPLLTAALQLTITRVIPDIDPAKGTFACRTTIAGKDRNGLLPGAFVTAEINLAGKTGEVIVPIRALVQQDRQSAVFVAEGGKMSRRVVEVGDRLTEGVIIKAGLQTGDRVIVGPADLLRDGVALPAYLVPSATQAATGS